MSSNKTAVRQNMFFHEIKTAPRVPWNVKWIFGQTEGDNELRVIIHHSGRYSSRHAVLLILQN
jgi:hypothetical protein